MLNSLNSTSRASPHCHLIHSRPAAGMDGLVPRLQWSPQCRCSRTSARSAHPGSPPPCGPHTPTHRLGQTGFSGTLFPGNQCAHFGGQFGRHGHDRDSFRFSGGFNFRKLLIFALVLVVRKHVADALFVPTGEGSSACSSGFSPLTAAIGCRRSRKTRSSGSGRSSSDSRGPVKARSRPSEPISGGCLRPEAPSA